MLSRNTTWTLTRDASLGLHFAGVTFYDGQGFMVPKSLKVKSAKQLKGATVCVQSGTTTELNLTDYSRANNLQIKPVVFEKLEAATGAYFAGRCQAYTTDASGLASIARQGSGQARRPRDPARADLQGAARPVGAPRRRRVLRHRQVGALRAARGRGIRHHAGQRRPDEEGQQEPRRDARMLGAGTEDTGKLLGLDKDWAYRAIKAVGNYGEIFERNVGPKTALELPRGTQQPVDQGRPDVRPAGALNRRRAPRRWHRRARGRWPGAARRPAMPRS